MKQKVLVVAMICIITTTALFLIIYIFLNKHYIPFEEVCKIYNVEDEKGFYPDAYVFFHSNREIENFFKHTNKYTELYGEKCKNIHFDFNNYSYVIVYGAKIKSMYYSYKTTIFNDKSPDYAKAHRYGDICVFIEYEEWTKQNNGIYFYKVKRNPKFRGFGGL